MRLSKKPVRFDVCRTFSLPPGRRIIWEDPEKNENKIKQAFAAQLCVFPCSHWQGPSNLSHFNLVGL